MIGYTSSFVCYYAFFIVGTVCAFVELSGATPACYISPSCIFRSNAMPLGLCEMYTKANALYCSLSNKTSLIGSD